MANRVAVPNLFAPNPPNWSLAQLDANAQAATGAINDSSLGAVNGPLSDTGSANAYIVACTYGTPSAYNDGMTVFFRPGNTNTGASTLTVSPLGSLPIVAGDSSALVGGELVAGNTIGVVCDGSAFRIISQPVAPLVTAVRLRSFNAIGNPSFEVDQRNVGNAVTGIFNTPSTFVLDRWLLGTSAAATMRFSSQQTSANIVVPGTNYFITQKFLRLTVTTAQASLAAGDWAILGTQVEGPLLRELLGDTHSVSILCRSSVANLKFGLNLQSPTGTIYGLSHLCSLGAANSWTLITCPAIPVWSALATWPLSSGSLGYYFQIVLAAGTSQIVSTNDTWLATTTVGAIGQSSFAATVNSTLDFAFCQHEPGAQCSTLIDKPFSGVNGNLEDCLRYYCKSYNYAVRAGTVDSNGIVYFYVPANGQAYMPVYFPKPMAKIPSVVGYSPVSGAINAVRDYTAGGDRPTTSTVNPGEKGFSGFTTSAQNAALSVQGFHYTADTGF